MTISAAQKSPTVHRDVAFAVPVVAAGLACLVLLALSDARGKVSFPPDDSLFSAQNWVQVAAIIIGGLLIALPHVPRFAKLAAGGVVLISAGLMFGTSVWAVKHWTPFGGITNIAPRRTDAMADLSLMLVVAALVAGLLAAGWLYRSGALTTGTAKNVRTASIVAGTITIIALPLMIGIGSGNDELMDVTSLGTFALLYSLPWGFAFFLASFLMRPAALGALTTAAMSITYITVVVLAEFEYAVVAASFGLLAMTSAWLITLTWRNAVRDQPESAITTP